MSGENVEVVRSLLGPFQRINLAEIDWGAEPICQLPAGSFSPEIEVRTLESGMGTGVDPVYNGVDGVVRYLQDWLEPFTDYGTEWLDDLRQRQLTRRQSELNRWLTCPG